MRGTRFGDKKTAERVAQRFSPDYTLPVRESVLLEPRTSFLEPVVLERLCDMAGTDAAGAYLDASNRTVADGLDLLQIGMPGPTGLVVGMADIIAEAGAFAAYFAYF